MKRIKVLIGCIIIIAGFACRDPYNPGIISSPDFYLVVEGVLNAGQGPTSVRLSRTYKMDDSARLRGEVNAQLVVEGKDNTTRQLTMTGDGIYTSPNLNLDLNQEYRLRIVTSNGKEYLSEYIAVKKTPAIDSLGFRQDENGVQVYVNTHDDSNNTRYYRWDYDETWEIRTYYHSEYKYVNDVVTPRSSADDVSVCWKYDFSKNIILGSTASLQSDIVFRAPVTFMGNGNEKLAVRYSILLRQYALDKQGYEFYEMMRKNTEAIGTVFDPQPTEIKGNIRCTTDPGEVIIGYISAAVIEEKRFFISSSQLDRWRFFQECPEEMVKNHPDSIRDAYAGGGSIYNALFSPMTGRITYYYASHKRCVECPARGGSLIKPSYW